MNKSVYVREKGVSEVIGTILILAITVVLFATIFTYVQHIPSPQKSPELIIQSSISVVGNNTIIQLTDLSGNLFSSNSTYIDVFYNGAIKSIPIFEITRKQTFGPGDNLTLNLSAYGIQVYNTSSLQLLIFSKQYNQILWHMGGFQLSDIYILNAYATPLPIVPGSTFEIFVTVYSIYNNTTVNVNLEKFLGQVENASFISQNGNFRDYIVSILSPESINIASEYAIITAKSGNKMATYNLSLYSSTSQSPDVFIVNQGISLQTPRPIHGSSDPMEILIRDNSPVAGTFNLFLYDRYPNGTVLPIQTNLGSLNYGNKVIVDANFSVGGFSAVTIYLIWNNVGGNGPGAGDNVLIAGLINIKGVNGVVQVPNPPNETYNVYVEPKILLINGQGIYSGTNEDVSEYYKVMLDYSGYSSDYISVNNGQTVNLVGYDLVIWFTGANPDGISNELPYIEQFYDEGGKVLIVAPNAQNFGGYPFENYPINNNVVMNLTQVALKTLNISEVKKVDLSNVTNMDLNVTSPGISFNISAFRGEWQNLTYMNYKGSSLATSGFVSNGNGGKAIVLGFEFARLPLYQQDYLGNKFIMWLFNISYIPGDQLALLDIIPSTYYPLFSQQMNISFYISNLSPVNLTTQLEVLFNGNFYNYYTVGNIPKDGGFIIYNISWNATPPGPTVVTGVLDPFHEIPQINYGLDIASSLVNTTIFTQYSVLILKVQKINGQTVGTYALNSSLKSLGIKYSWYLYNPSSTINYTNLFKRYNAVIVSTDNTINNNLDLSKLKDAIESYYELGTTTMSGLYSMAFLGNGTSNLFSQEATLGQLFSISFDGYASLSPSPISGLYSIYGNNVSSVNSNIFGNYFSNSLGYLLSLQIKGSSTSQIYYIKGEDGNIIPVLSNQWGNGGEAIGVIGYQSGFRFFVGDFGLSQISGIIQPHSSQFEPSNPTNQSRLLFTLMLMGYFNYSIPKVIPYVISSSIMFSSNILMLDRYYIVNSMIVNLGDKGGSLEVEAFDGSGLFSTQTVYLPQLSVVPVQFIWEPQFAALPESPRDIRIVISYVTGNYLKNLSFLREGIATTPVYVFYDNLSTGENWHSYDVVWAWEGVNNYVLTNQLYSAEPYSVDGIAANFTPGNKGGGYVVGQSSNLFSHIGSYWGVFPNSYSGGYSIGTSANFVNAVDGYYDAWNESFTYSRLMTESLSVHNAKYAYLELNALFKLSLGGEGVAVFISSSGQGEARWQWIAPIQGYPGNVNYSPINNSGFNFPENSKNLLPAFTTVSGGANFQWQHYTFNITGYNNDSSISIMFVLILDGNYNMDVYGNDFFFMDDVKVVENGTVTGAGSTQGDLWERSYSHGQWYYNSSYIYPGEVDNVVSVPISLLNLVNATLDFQTQYSIYVRFANGSNYNDVPNGFRLYVGFVGSNGQMIWNQLDTRWAGEAGLLDNQWYDAASVMSAYYSGVYAFHQTGSYISLSGYIGLTVYLKFEVNGNSQEFFDSTYGYQSGMNGVYSPSSSNNNWAAFTDVIITGNSYADLITVSQYW